VTLAALAPVGGSPSTPKAVERQGFVRNEGNGRRRTHRVWARSGKPGERHNRVLIPLKQRRIPDETIGSILRQLGIDERPSALGSIASPAARQSLTRPDMIREAAAIVSVRA
jgi:hypothetical protein